MKISLQHFKIKCFKCVALDVDSFKVRVSKTLHSSTLQEPKQGIHPSVSRYVLWAAVLLGAYHVLTSVWVKSRVSIREIIQAEGEALPEAALHTRPSRLLISEPLRSLPFFVKLIKSFFRQSIHNVILYTLVDSKTCTCHVLIGLICLFLLHNIENLQIIANPVFGLNYIF